MRGLLPLFLAKSFRFLDGKEQLLFQLFEALVRRQVQTVETEKTDRNPKISIKRTTDWMMSV